jgi:hypothetical protein
MEDVVTMRGAMNIGVTQVTALAVTWAAAFVLSCGGTSIRAAEDRALAVSLANDTSRPGAVSSIVAAGRAKIPILLYWSRQPPDGIPECALDTGLAEAFGELKSKEAIPFLIKNIGMYRSCGASFSPWLKTSVTIEWNLPAVGALVKIGPEASRAVINGFRDLTAEEDRRAAIFVVSQIKGVPEARSFLESALGRADRERYWAGEGIRRLDAGSSAKK